jgi:AraC-like DNA-binding protein
MTILERAKPYIPDLEARRVTVRDLANLLGCHETHLSRVLKGHVKRVKSAHQVRLSRSKLARARKEMRKKHAFAVKNGEKSLKKAAADAKCSERTIRRYMKEL